MKKKRYLITTYGSSKEKFPVLFVFKMKNGRKDGVYLTLDENENLSDKIADIPEELFFESYEEAKKNLKKMSRYASIAGRIGAVSCEEKLVIKKIWV